MRWFHKSTIDSMIKNKKFGELYKRIYLDKDIDINAEAHKKLRDLVNSCKTQGDIDTLIEIARQDIPHIFYPRDEAIRAIGELKSPSSVGFLIDFLRIDHYFDTRKDAIVALGRIRDKRAIVPLLNELRLSFAYEAAQALAEIGVESVCPLIEVIKGADKIFGETLATDIELSNRGKLDHLTRRQRAISALEVINDPKAVDVMIQSLADEDDNVQISAIMSLCNMFVNNTINDNRIIDEFIKLKSKESGDAITIIGPQTMPFIEKYSVEETYKEWVSTVIAEIKRREGTDYYQDKRKNLRKFSAYRVLSAR